MDTRSECNGEAEECTSQQSIVIVELNFREAIFPYEQEMERAVCDSEVPPSVFDQPGSV